MNFDLKAPATQYGLVTLSYWAFTLSDGALRMLVVLFFHQLGYSPIEIAGLLVLYELFGVITNLYAGWLATHIGLTVTMQMGLALQIAALLMLTVDSSILNVVYVMVAQALSGIGKDLNKMGAKASIKSLVPADAQGQLYHWIALLTGSKNALKGVGFFLGGWLLATVGFQNAVAAMATALGRCADTQFSAARPQHRDSQKTSAVPTSVLQEQRSQSAQCSAILSVWLTGCLVCCGTAGIFAEPIAMELCAGGDHDGRLGNRLRCGANSGP